MVDLGLSVNFLLALFGGKDKHGRFLNNKFLVFVWGLVCGGGEIGGAKIQTESVCLFFLFFVLFFFVFCFLFFFLG